MYKNSNRNLLKKIFSLLFTIVLLTTFINPAFAEERSSNNNISNNVSEGIITELNAISNQKELFGLNNINFENISLGNQIHAYEYTNGKLNELNFCLYPLTINEKLVAFAIKDNNTINYQITTNLVNETSSNINSNESFALVYDNNICYAYTKNGLISLCKVRHENSNRQKIDKVTDVSNIKETKLNHFSSVQLLGYSSSTENTSSTLSDSTAATTSITTTSSYVSCSVSFVTQNPPSKYCWASSVACIGNFLKGKNYTGIYVAQYLYGTTDYNKGANGPTSISTLNNIYGTSYSYYGSTPSENVIYSNISSGKPLFSGWTYSSYGHACVIYGINIIGGYIYIMDPEYGFCSGSSNGSTYSFTSLYSGVTWSLIGYGV